MEKEPKTKPKSAKRPDFDNGISKYGEIFEGKEVFKSGKLYVYGDLVVDTEFHKKPEDRDPRLNKYIAALDQIRKEAAKLPEADDKRIFMAEETVKKVHEIFGPYNEQTERNLDSQDDSREYIKHLERQKKIYKDDPEKLKELDGEIYCVQSYLSDLETEHYERKQPTNLKEIAYGTFDCKHFSALTTMGLIYNDVDCRCVGGFVTYENDPTGVSGPHAFVVVKGVTEDLKPFVLETTDPEASVITESVNNGALKKGDTMIMMDGGGMVAYGTGRISKEDVHVSDFTGDELTYAKKVYEFDHLEMQRFAKERRFDQEKALEADVAEYKRLTKEPLTSEERIELKDEYERIARKEQRINDKVVEITFPEKFDKFKDEVGKMTLPMVLYANKAEVEKDAGVSFSINSVGEAVTPDGKPLMNEKFYNTMGYDEFATIMTEKVIQISFDFVKDRKPAEYDKITEKYKDNPDLKTYYLMREFEGIGKDAEVKKQYMERMYNSCTEEMSRSEGDVTRLKGHITGSAYRNLLQYKSENEKKSEVPTKESTMSGVDKMQEAVAMLNQHKVDYKQQDDISFQHAGMNKAQTQQMIT